MCSCVQQCCLLHSYICRMCYQNCLKMSLRNIQNISFYTRMRQKRGWRLPARPMWTCWDSVLLYLSDTAHDTYLPEGLFYVIQLCKQSVLTACQLHIQYGRRIWLTELDFSCLPDKKETVLNNNPWNGYCICRSEYLSIADVVKSLHDSKHYSSESGCSEVDWFLLP